MRHTKKWISVIVSFVFASVCYGQVDNSIGIVDYYAQYLDSIGNDIDSIYYKVRMSFKEFGSTEIESKEFLVGYGANDKNPLYGYDYAIMEIRENDTVVTMALDNSFYVILTGKKFISGRNLPSSIDLSNYFENIRSNYILKEVIMPFLYCPADELTVSEVGDYYLFKRRMNDAAVRQLTINKYSKLPSSWSSVITNDDLGLEQHLVIDFNFDNIDGANLRRMLSVERYFKAGYDLSATNSSSDKLESDSTLSISESFREKLLLYSLIYPDSSEVKIRDLSSNNYVLIDFWFASCLPCLSAMPELDELYKKYGNDGLIVLPVNCFDKKIMKNLSARFEAKSISLPLLFGEQDLVDSLKITSYPTYYLLAPDGNIQLIKGGISRVKMIVEELFSRK